MESGLYEQVINHRIEEYLKNPNRQIPISEDIDSAEAPMVLSRYVASLIEKRLADLGEGGGRNKLDNQIRLVNGLIDLLSREDDGMEVSDEGKLLTALIDGRNTAYALNPNSKVVRPETSVAHSSLFTGAAFEPGMYTELKKEILSSDRIDMLVSFIKWSGLRLIMDELREFTQKGGRLRIITTSYMGATDIKAVEELRKLPNTEIKVSYDTKRTRLHAKTYVFYRDTGFTTAYVGSSNLSGAAISGGLEWNVKVTAKDLPDVIQKISGTFESYLNSDEFETYDESEKPRLEHSLNAEKHLGEGEEERYFFDIVPYSYQKQILDKLEAERQVRGNYRNLVVAATGTGKTVISAFDYKNFRAKHPNRRNTLLFVAHREEILKQSLDTFRGILKDANFGGLLVGKHTSDDISHLFISIQSFNSQKLYEKTDADFYDFIIVDEFHHAAAPSYKTLLNFYKPKILLGLTATPERMDGENILEYFNNRIAAEIRLPEAIDRKLLCPFHYFGITDSVDLSRVKWSRGGYDRGELSDVYTIESYGASVRAELVARSVEKYVTDIDAVRGLGFCVSIEHARFMAERFNSWGIPSIHLTGESDSEERSTAKSRLVAGEIKFIFVVDIYNEGVDIPEINTVLFLRPTESLTVFLQQLGRGLRLSEGKECLTVLDFIGQANNKYNFEEKFSALLSNTGKSVEREIKEGFVSVPTGCFIQLEKVAKEYVLKNIKSAFNRRSGLISRIATFTEDSGLELNLENFVSYYHLDVRTIYKSNSFSRLCAEAGVIEDFGEDLEKTMTGAFSRICAIDSRRWIKFLLEVLREGSRTDFSDNEIRMLKMFNYTVWNKTDREMGFDSPMDGIREIRKTKVMLSELIELLEFNYGRIDFIDAQADLDYECPMDLYCTYSKAQLLLALDLENPSAMREGVKYIEEKKTDVFLVTLNKSDKDYSPSTMYKDYSISDTLFHWQSQSTTGEDSPTGRRYRNHRETGNKIMLFVREKNRDSFGLTSGYTFLGLADFVSSKGSAPMNIVWKLHRPIPAKYLRKTNQLIG